MMCYHFSMSNKPKDAQRQWFFSQDFFHWMQDYTRWTILWCQCSLEKKSYWLLTSWSCGLWSPVNLSLFLPYFLFFFPFWSCYLLGTKIYKHKHINANTIGITAFWTSEINYLSVIFREALRINQIIDLDI